MVTDTTPQGPSPLRVARGLVLLLAALLLIAAIYYYFVPVQVASKEGVFGCGSASNPPSADKDGFQFGACQKTAVINQFRTYALLAGAAATALAAFLVFRSPRSDWEDDDINLGRDGDSRRGDRGARDLRAARSERSERSERAESRELRGARREDRPRAAEVDDEPAEAKLVAKRIRELLAKGVPASEIAILYRINAQSAVHEAALTEAGIPYQVRGGSAFFERPEIGQAVRALMERAGQFGGVAGDELLSLVKGALEPLGLTPEAPDGARALERWQALGALVELTADLAKERPGLTLAELIGELRARAEAKHPPTMQGVTLSSLHAAKGLEWDAVFLVGLTEGSVPISQAIAKGDPEPIEEERRLLYVGVTRAREHLHLSWALARNEGGRKTRKRTRFLDVVAGQADAGRPRADSGPSKGKRRSSDICRVCGGILDTREEKLRSRCEDCPSDLNDELVEALKIWRTGQARDQQVPPYTIFSNATLFAIAEHQPRTRAQLVRINGIGSTKVDKYGDEVLALVSEHA